MQAATIKLFLPTGDATGIRTAEISNWTGKAIAGPRSELKELLHREELSRPGVYILIGNNDDNDPVIYIGEAECVKTRLKQHQSREFWVQVIAFVSKDENLTKGHIKYLEAELINKAKNVDKALLENSQSGNAVLPESDVADMEVFLSKLMQLLPVLGTDVFTEIEEKTTDAEILQCKIKGLVAKGKRTVKGFVVYQGSQAVLVHRDSALHTHRKRESLTEKGVLIQEGEHYVFTRDYEFGSPSAAGAVIRGGSTNGLTAWKNTAGKSLKQLELQQG